MNTVQANGSLNGNLFTQLMVDSHPEGKPKGYLYRNSASKAYAVFYKPKQSKDIQKGFVPLCFRDIVLLGLSLSADLCKKPDLAESVSSEIKRMNERKVVKERNRRFFSQFSSIICDCAKNMFAGYGFKSTTQLAIELGWDLTQAVSKEHKPLVLPSSSSPPVLPIPEPKAGVARPEPSPSLQHIPVPASVLVPSPDSVPLPVSVPKPARAPISEVSSLPPPVAAPSPALCPLPAQTGATAPAHPILVLPLPDSRKLPPPPASPDAPLPSGQKAGPEAIPAPLPLAQPAPVLAIPPPVPEPTALLVSTAQAQAHIPVVPDSKPAARKADEGLLPEVVVVPDALSVPSRVSFSSQSSSLNRSRTTSMPQVSSLPPATPSTLSPVAKPPASSALSGTSPAFTTPATSSSGSSRPPLQRTSSRLNKKQALAGYKQDLANCDRLTKTVIWMEINEIDNERPYHTDDPITTVVHLMKYVSDSNDVDLRNDKCGQVVVDTFRLGKKLVCSNLVQWLKKKKSFHPALLKSCLEIFVEKASEGTSASSLTYEPLTQLLQIYMDREWGGKAGHHHRHHDAPSGPVLPVNDPVLVDAIAVLLQNQPNLDFAQGFVEWMDRQPGYDLKTWLKLIRVYRDHEASKGAGLNLLYPTRDKLFEIYESKQDFRDEIVKDSNAGDVVSYLQTKGVTI